MSRAKPRVFPKKLIKQILVEAAEARLTDDQSVAGVLRKYKIHPRHFEIWEAKYGKAGRDMEW